MAELKEDVVKLKGNVAELQGDVAELKEDVVKLQGDVAELKEDVVKLQGDVAELQGDVVRLKGDVHELQQKFEGIVEPMTKDVKNLTKDVKILKRDVKELQLTLENETNRNISIIAEGHLDLSRRLDEALKVENGKEIMSVRINILESEVRRLRDKVAAMA